MWYQCYLRINFDFSSKICARTTADTIISKPKSNKEPSKPVFISLKNGLALSYIYCTTYTQHVAADLHPSDLGTQNHWLDQLHLISAVFSGKLALATASRAISVPLPHDFNGAIWGKCVRSAVPGSPGGWLYWVHLRTEQLSFLQGEKRSKTVFSEMVRIYFASCYDLMSVLHLPFWKQQSETKSKC